MAPPARAYSFQVTPVSCSGIEYGRPDPSAHRPEFLAHQGVLRAQKQLARGCHQARVTPFTLRRIVLIQQHITVMTAAGKIVDHEKLYGMRAQPLLPISIKSIVIHHQPIGLRTRKGGDRLLGVFSLRHAEPRARTYSAFPRRQRPP